MSGGRDNLSLTVECKFGVRENHLVQEEAALSQLPGSDEMGLVMELPLAPQRLVKSSDRVRDLGEVFTPETTVKEMLNLLPKNIWNPHPSATFLEPACGDGNFLVSILDRKLERVSKDFTKGKLPAGLTLEAAQFHALEALSSIYAVDISSDNIVGGTPGHEIGARTRLVSHFSEWNHQELGKVLSERSSVLKSARWIVEHNLIVGNMLASDSTGRSTGREHIPLIDYSWNPEKQSVVLHKTTMGSVIDAEEASTSSTLSLFTIEEPTEFWSGKAFSISNAERVEAPTLRGPVRNGTGRRIG